VAVAVTPFPDVAEAALIRSAISFAASLVAIEIVPELPPDAV